MIIRLKSGIFMRLQAIIAVVLVVLVNAGCDKKNAVSKDAQQVAPASIEASMPAQSSVVIEVDGAKLTQGEFEKRMSRMMMAQGLTGMPSDQIAQARSALEQNVIEEFTAQTLLLNETERQKISDDSEVADVLTKLKADIPKGQTFETVLQTYGMTEADLRADIQKDVKIRKLLDKEVAAADATDEEVKSFYDTKREYFNIPETVHARHILVMCPAESDEAKKTEKKALAEECRKQLLAGSDFAEMASKYSECPSKSEGGDLGTFPKGRMVPEFETAAFSQKINDIGEIIQTQYGYHIIQVLERNEAKVKSFEEVKATIVKYLKSQKRNKSVVGYIEKLKSTASIKYADEKPSGAVLDEKLQGIVPAEKTSDVVPVEKPSDVVPNDKSSGAAAK